MPMLYKNALLLALSTFVMTVQSPAIGAIRDIINHGWRNDKDDTRAAQAKLAQLRIMISFNCMHTETLHSVHLH